MEKTRMEAFSDGVFAIAITLLVLDLRVPEVGDGSLTHALATQWPYARTPNATSAAVAYGAVLLTAGADVREVSGITRSYRPDPLLSRTATLIAFANADASLVMYAAIAIFYVASASLWGRRRPAV